MPELTNRPSATGGIPRAILVGLFLGPWTVWWGVWVMITGSLRLKRLCHWCLKCWGGGIVSVAGIRVEVTGAPPQNGQPCVFFVNHQSALDIPILFRACMKAHDVRFMAKESLFKIPFLGWGMSLSGFIPIRRESARHAAEVFQERLTKNAASYSYIIFPEGTRSPDGRLQPFKRGAVGLALRLGLPVVPVTLVDACRANPKGMLLVRPGTVRVTFHEPIAVDANAPREQRDQLLERVYAAILSALPDDQRPKA
jgi:1-acyl-sn-glycerol-3-phosphate acyltransferase